MVPPDSDLPIDGRQSDRRQVRIGLGKVLALEKLGVEGVGRRRVRRLQHLVFAAICDAFTLFLRGGTPQQEHHVRAALVEHVNDVIGELLPCWARPWKQ